MQARYCSSHEDRQGAPLQDSLHPTHVLPQAPAQLAPGASARCVLGVAAARKDPSAVADPPFGPAPFEPVPFPPAPFAPAPFAPAPDAAPIALACGPLLAFPSAVPLEAGVIVCGGGA